MRQRLIPILLIRDGALMKSTKFHSWKYVGDPLNTAKIFNAKDTDELVILDVDATKEAREPNYELLKSLAAECFLPLAYGGGINSEVSAKRVVECGIDKVIINSSLAHDSTILSRISDSIGSSSTMASLDVIRDDIGLQLRNRKGTPLEETISDLERQGAGELLVQAVELDGTRLGPDLDLAQKVVEASKIPVVYAGGVASLEDTADLWKLGIDGVAAGSWFVFQEPHDAVLVTYPARKKIIAAMKEV
jgi:imidazole glycerol-phosphate synthase subunit HisF